MHTTRVVSLYPILPTFRLLGSSCGSSCWSDPTPLPTIAYHIISYHTIPRISNMSNNNQSHNNNKEAAAAASFHIPSLIPPLSSSSRVGISSSSSESSLSSVFAVNKENTERPQPQHHHNNDNDKCPPRPSTPQSRLVVSSSPSKLVTYDFCRSKSIGTMEFPCS